MAFAVGKAGTGQCAPGVLSEHMPYCVGNGEWVSLSEFSFILA